MGPREFALTLALTPGCGGKTTARILSRNELLSRSPQEFFALPEESLIEEYRLPMKLAKHLANRPKEEIREQQAMRKRLDELGVVWCTVLDAGYPALVDQMDPDPPGVLFLYGNTKLLESATFAVLSSRKGMRSDLDQIESLAEEGVLKGQVLVAGHDTTEYQRAAVVPLRYGSPRILCLDKGLFPVLGHDLSQEAFRSARLYRYQFDAKTDLVVSPFRPESEFIGVNNRLRDKLVACLASRLDFVKVAPGGNMEKLLKLACKAGRPVRVSDRNLDYKQYVALGAEAI